MITTIRSSEFSMKTSMMFYLKTVLLWLKPIHPIAEARISKNSNPNSATNVVFLGDPASPSDT
jgi:hypothetical protein